MSSCHDSDSPVDVDRLVTDHRRQWRSCRFAYPVISRRAQGLSIGVNLNIDKRCNFRCRYCQINRRLRRDPCRVDIPRLQAELTEVLAAVADGSLWDEQRFQATPPALRRINDIAFSGDGEPTCLENFDEAVAAAATVLAAQQTRDVQLVVITNATQLRSPQVRRALPILDANKGQFWCKLDAGSEPFFQKVNRPMPGLTLETICENILAVSLARPVAIQTLFFAFGPNDSRTVGPSAEELDAYIRRLRWLLGCEAQLSMVQLHTIARTPDDTQADALADDTLDTIAEQIRSKIPPIPVNVYYGQPQPTPPPTISP